MALHSSLGNSGSSHYRYEGSNISNACISSTLREYSARLRDTDETVVLTVTCESLSAMEKDALHGTGSELSH